MTALARLFACRDPATKGREGRIGRPYVEACRRKRTKVWSCSSSASIRGGNHMCLVAHTTSRMSSVS
eukprot:5849444-Pyramimonas_sp.AAC.1